MMYVWKRCVGLVLAVLMVVLCMSALIVVQTPVYAWDSSKTIRSANDLRDAVKDLPSSPSSAAGEKEYVAYIAGELTHMTDTGKREARESDIKKLAKFYNTYFGGDSSGKDDIEITGDTRETSSKRIDEDDSYVYGYHAVTGSSGRMEVEQYKSSGSVKLRMDLNGFNGPVFVSLELKGSPFSSSKDYYLKCDGSSKKLDVSVSKDSVRFVAPEEGEYKLYQDDDKDDDDDDYDYDDLSTFWQDVVDDIEDAKSGARVRVSMGSRTSMPTDVLRALKGKAVTLALTESNGNIISIYGKDVKIPSGSSVSLSTLRSTYDKDTSQSSATSSSSSSSSSGSSSSAGGLPVSPLPGGLAGTANGSTGTPNAGGGPTSPPAVSPLPTVNPSATALPVSPLPKLPSAASSSSSSAPSSSSEESSSEPVSSEFDTDFRPDQPEAEIVNIQEPIDLPRVPQGSDTRIGRVVNKVGVAGVLAFIGLAAVTAALGGGLLSYAILSRKNGK